METKLTKKEAATEGISIGGFTVTLIVLVLFGWSPMSYYLGHWSNYWEDKNISHTSTTVDYNSYATYYSDAITVCYKRAEKYFGTDEVRAEASSTDETTAYKTYDCYGVKFTKIP